MTQNIEEQFVPPLFSQTGNRKRHSYGYINYCHSIRLDALNEN